MIDANDLVRIVAVVRKEIRDRAQVALEKLAGELKALPTKDHVESTVRAHLERLPEILSAERIAAIVNTEIAKLPKALTKDDVKRAATAVARAELEQLPPALTRDDVERMLHERLSQIPTYPDEEKVNSIARTRYDESVRYVDERLRSLPRGLSPDEVETVISAQMPGLQVECVTVDGVTEKARAEVRKEGKTWVMKLYIPVYRWMGAGFVAQGQQAGNAAATQQFYVQPNFPQTPISGVPLLLYQTGQFSDPTILQPWVLN